MGGALLRTSAGVRKSLVITCNEPRGGRRGWGSRGVWGACQQGGRLAGGGPEGVTVDVMRAVLTLKGGVSAQCTSGRLTASMRTRKEASAWCLLRAVTRRRKEATPVGSSGTMGEGGGRRAEADGWLIAACIASRAAAAEEEAEDDDDEEEQADSDGIGKE